MKATDLMIGDWVQIVPDAPIMSNEYHGIDWIRTGEIGLDNRKIVTYPYIQPVPLTPEILEKNGFVYDSHCNGWECSIDKQLAGDGFELQIITIYGLRMITITTAIADMTLHLKSVHELQHALKLCGIEKEITL